MVSQADPYNKPFLREPGFGSSMVDPRMKFMFRTDGDYPRFGADPLASGPSQIRIDKFLYGEDPNNMKKPYTVPYEI